MTGILSANKLINELHEIKAAIALALAEVVSYIAASGNNPDNILNDIIKLSRMLDIAAPAARTTPLTILDPRYNLLDYIKRHAGSMAIKEIDGDEILFEKDKPFTCISQVQEIFLDVSDKLMKNFASNDNDHEMSKQAEYA